MGAILGAFEQQQFDPERDANGAAKVKPWHRPDAALSLQALLLETERRRIVAANRALTVRVAPGAINLSGPPGTPPPSGFR